MRLDAYIRVSSVGGRAGETFISPDVQQEKTHGWVALHGHTLGQTFVELDESGGTMERPLFQQAVDRVERRESDGIVVAKLDRFGRTLAGALEALRRIEDAGGQLVSVDDQFDSSTPMGRFALQIMLAIAELEHARIRDNWDVARRRAVARGVHVTARVPVGYLKTATGRLEPDPATAEAIREAFRLRATGAGSTAIAAMLNQAGVATSYGGRWIGETIRRLLSNRVYLGEARAGDSIVLPGAHEPLVEAHTFALANAAPDRRAPNSPSLLAGLLRCAGCRYTMSRSAKNRRYRCRIEHTAGRCPNPTAVVDRHIEALVIERFLAMLDDSQPVGHIIARELTVEPIRAQLAISDAELAAWRDDQQIVALGRAVYLEGLEARIRRRDTDQETLQAALADAGAAGSLERAIALRDKWDDLPVEDQRTLLASTIDVVFLRRGRNTTLDTRTLILWRGEGPTDLPRRAKTVPLSSYTFPPDGHVEAGMLATQNQLVR